MWNKNLKLSAILYETKYNLDKMRLMLFFEKKQ